MGRRITAVIESLETRRMFATLDLTNNVLVVAAETESSTTASIKAHIIAARNVAVGGVDHGSWDGSDVTGAPHIYTGYADLDPRAWFLDDGPTLDDVLITYPLTSDGIDAPAVDPIPPNTAAESGSINFAIDLGTATTQETKLRFSTRPDSAKSGRDYRNTSGTITLAPGTSIVNVPVTLIDDAAYEGDRTFKLRWSTNGPDAQSNTLTGTILDDEPMPSISIDDASVIEPAKGKRAVDAVITLSGAMRSPLSVDYSTSDGTATAPADYPGAHGKIHIAAGKLQAHVRLFVFADTAVEGDRTFFVDLAPPVNVIPFKLSGQITIADTTIASAQSGTVADQTLGPSE
jgi:hypothetical protein